MAKLGDTIIQTHRKDGSVIHTITRDDYPDMDDAQWSDFVSNAKSNAAKGANFTFKKIPSAAEIDTAPEGNTIAHDAGSKLTQTDSLEKASQAPDLTQTPSKTLTPEELAATQKNLDTRRHELRAATGEAPGMGSKMQSAAESAAPVIEALGNAASKVFNPIGSATQALSDFADPKNNHAEPPKQVSDIPGAPAAPPELPTGKGALSMPGEEPHFGSVGVPASKDFGPEAAKAEEDRINGLVATEKAKGQAALQLANVYRIRQEEDQRYAADTLATEQAQAQRLDKFQQHFDSIAAEQAKLDPTIDPTRYWKNKSGGQIALGAIAGALFGFQGQGMNYLKMIQDEVNTDVEAQRATFDNSNKRLAGMRSDLDSSYARARQAGLSDKEARAAAHVATLSSLDSYMGYMQSQTQDQMAQAKMQELRAGLGAAKVKALQEGFNAASENSHRAASAVAAVNTANAAMRNAETNRMMADTARIKVDFKGTSGAKALPEAAQTKLDTLNAKRLRAIHMAELSGGSAGEKLVRGAQATGPAFTESGRKAKNQDKEYAGGVVEGMRDLAGSSLQRHEMEALKGAVPTDRNAVGEDPQGYWKARAAQYEKEMREQLKAHGQSFDVSEWESDLSAGAPANKVGFKPEESE